jgi:prolipoprotein diacylglyceryltransferase
MEIWEELMRNMFGDMLNGGGIIHGGCSAFLIDMYVLSSFSVEFISLTDLMLD